MASAFLVAFHRLLAWATFKSKALSGIFSGAPPVLIRDGELLPEEMNRQQFSMADLEESLRLHGQVADPREVEEARFERNGKVSVVRRAKPQPEILEIQVAEGVQTVRIEIR